MPVLMSLSILAIALFQLYWLKKAYEREERTLEIRTNMAFRETIFALQATKLKLDRPGGDSVLRYETFEKGDVHIRTTPGKKIISMVNVLRDKMRNSDTGSLFADRTIVLNGRLPFDSTSRPSRKHMREQNRIMQFLYDMESLQDTIRVREIHNAYAKRLQQQNLSVPFSIHRLNKTRDDDERVFNEVTIGFKNPITYKLQLGNTLPYLMKRISAPVLLSLFLVAFTVVSFSLLYRNLIRQKKLADIKNEFISNITHELKTPIATVSVAIEALRSFNATMDAQKTKEYLDISANELQRLSMLVDKVLKLSMFEKKEVELKYEPLDMKALVEEVTASMRLQFEKHKAKVNVSTNGDTSLKGDRLHLVSVIFNMVDNALKYSNGSPVLNINIEGSHDKIKLLISDNGIGIPAEYKEKIFEKFFRVPTGNVHNAKGYGLGLSYVAHVIKKHKGTISVEAKEEGGSNFVISLPRQHT